jgi:3-deoxy-D-manno-octulosonic-acid transferase
MQTESDRVRILQLGAPPGRTEVCGNLKYDLQVPEGIEPWLERYRDILGLRDKSLLLVAGSTMEEEEEQVLAAFHHLKKENPSAVLILAPRHPERFGEVENLLATRGFQFQKRSSLDGKNTVRQGNIILLDSIGELANLYALADLVFVGGSLVPRGGHNILEPALFRKPIVFGPHMNNFREIADYFLSHQGAIRVRDEAELSLQLLRLARDPQLRGRLGEKAFQILQASSGATRRILDQVELVLDRKDRRPESKELR